jgi:hypothetical protein
VCTLLVGLIMDNFCLQKLVLRVAKHQKQIGADILAVQDLQSRMSHAEVSLGAQHEIKSWHRSV